MPKFKTGDRVVVLKTFEPSIGHIFTKKGSIGKIVWMTFSNQHGNIWWVKFPYEISGTPVLEKSLRKI
jgi:hypothetical protein